MSTTTLPGVTSEQACRARNSVRPAWDEDSGVDVNAQAAELGPSEDGLEWFAGNSSVDHRVEFIARACGVKK